MRNGNAAISPKGAGGAVGTMDTDIETWSHVSG
jgi:hypothetical protein